MKRIGILVGREETFPESLIRTINERGQGEVVAEMLKIGGVRIDESRRYDLIIDRISHEVPFYRSFLKRAAIEGTIVINNPFWWSADDKFFNYSLASKLGVAIPRTVLLPQKSYVSTITNNSLRNLEYPLNWQEIIDYVGLPAIMKPIDGGGWKNVSKIDSIESLWREYDQTGTLCMVLQEMIEYEQFVRCYCIGQEEVMIMPYDPSKPYMSGEQYRNEPNYLTAEVANRITNDTRTICHALGYDINTVEFAIKGGVPFAIDFMNPAPDADLYSVGEFYHSWVTRAVTDLIFRRLSEPAPQTVYRWDRFLNPMTAIGQIPTNAFAAVASMAEQAAKTIIPEPVREIGSTIVEGVGGLVAEAASTVTEIIAPSEPKSTKKAAAKKPRSTTSASKKRATPQQ
jgi:glutathione synthase/RimK-type ligase-like ATP-grasp enzyme